MTPDALIFDVFGTLVDWRSSIARHAEARFSAKEIVGMDGHAFADHWRGRYQPAMARIREGDRGYVALDDLHAENLAETLDHFCIADRFDLEERAVFARDWERLDPWPDVVAGLTMLKRHAIIAPCSNGSIALMARLARHGGLPWDCILGADIARDYKPKPAVYHACCDALRLPADRVMMVACHNSDLAAARECGLLTGFIVRPTEYGPEQDFDLAANEDWDIVADDLPDLATRLFG